MTNHLEDTRHNHNCDICGEPLGAEDQHTRHPDGCEARYGEDCECEVVVELHELCCTDCHPELEPEEVHRAERGKRFLPDFKALVQIPQLYETEPVSTQDKIVHLHFVSPAGEWWIVERDRQTNQAFGYACLNDPANAEWGYVDLSELEALTIPITLSSTPAGYAWALKLFVERDLEWVARPVRNCGLPGWR